MRGVVLGGTLIQLDSTTPLIHPFLIIQRTSQYSSLDFELFHDASEGDNYPGQSLRRILTFGILSGVRYEEGLGKGKCVYECPGRYKGGKADRTAFL
jgi:hypothetical protein